LEWYELGASEQDGINLLSQLARHVMRCEEVDVWDYRQVFQTYLGVDPIDDSKEALVEIASQCDQELAKSLATDRDGLLDVLLSELIQPQLGVERPLIVRNYPLTQAALAKVAPDDPNCASRFELFVGGIELANGYDELRDEKVLVERINKSQMKRLKAGLKLVRPPAEAVLAEISHQLPQCAGVALGVDRLHLVRSGKQSLNQISPYHW
jgi:lysyl-tRNA synthetase class 2